MTETSEAHEHTFNQFLKTMGDLTLEHHFKREKPWILVIVPWMREWTNQSKIVVFAVFKTYRHDYVVYTALHLIQQNKRTTPNTAYMFRIIDN